MVPAAVAVKRSKTISIIVLAAATVLAALWLGPRAPRPTTAVGTSPFATPPPGDPCSMTLTNRLSSTHVMAGAREEHLVVTLRAPSCGQNTVRPPMSLAIVLDRSGSMAPENVPVADQPLTHAKAAAAALIAQLEPSDAFSVVAYAGDAEVVMAMTFATPDAKLAAARAIAAIRDGSGTNIAAGLDLGRSEVGHSPLLDGVRRLILISDGAANQGVYTRDGLARLAAGIAADGASISSVGLGLEYNEGVMTDIAAAGRGNYYFVEESTELAGMFTAELGSLGKTVAVDADLALEPAPGVEILAVYSYGAHLDGTTWKVPVADLAAGETRKIVARIRIRAATGNTMELATARLVYRPIDAHQERIVTAVARAEVTTDAKVVRAGIDTGTLTLVEEAETANAIEAAATVYQHEGADRANAILDERMQQARATADAYGDPRIAGKSLDAAQSVKRDFSAAPAGGSSGNKAKKASSKAAYELAR